eukprot:TRINITY_DN2234_c0_g1_i23.p1 TRINITY_DN2234_c0_g1~~TRINITY_DN2234_c0_g1_i23.p1  ORF type:complete len:511 (-),score=1.12 TRINITY_DN2234_c0_g1_i23:303-1793(-)
MYVNVNDTKVPYDKGVPQGSILSPMMFALVFDKILREANSSGWKLLAYADDVAICVKNEKEYQNAIEWLTTWKAKANLEINKAKTVEMRFGKMKRQIGKFQTVTEFKYLGVYIYGSYRAKCARTRLLKQADEYRVKAERAKHTNVGAAKIAWIWWTVSKILYAAVSDVALGWLKVGKVEQICLKAARKTYGINKGVSNDFVANFLEISVKPVLLRMAEKLRQQLGEELCIQPRMREPWRKEWIRVATRNDLQVNIVWRWKAPIIWSKQGKLRCKICGSEASLLHFHKHQASEHKFMSFLIALKEKGISAIVEYYSKHGGSECDRMLQRTEECYRQMMAAGKFAKDIFRISHCDSNSISTQIESDGSHTCTSLEAVCAALQCRGEAVGFPLQGREWPSMPKAPTRSYLRAPSRPGPTPTGSSSPFSIKVRSASNARSQAVPKASAGRFPIPSRGSQLRHRQSWKPLPLLCAPPGRSIEPCTMPVVGSPRRSSHTMPG